MTISVWLAYAKDKLESAGIGTARLDSQLLLADILQQDRSWLMAHLDTIVTDETRAQLEPQLLERAKHVPLAYIRGKTEFYGREFLVDKRVLEPRPESETMIDILKKLPGSNESNLEIIDVGTGSGALAITAKLELPQATVVATDIDPGCLQVAETNASKHHVDINFTQGDLLEPISNAPGLSVVTLANLPYVPDDYQINQAAMQEPRLAIFGGSDGLDPYRKLFAQAASFYDKPSYILTESLPPQQKQLALIAARHGFRQIQTDDFIQVFQGGHQQGVAYNTES
ncbi:peptide chain release factor N(5)-glutamine methyltransferase [Candidatus Saccharibacteria bacterium]|nr:peptide chain release factor N(5)-glutamine methyltransferase [Candidatus Saccharibacteria bacterium]